MRQFDDFPQNAKEVYTVTRIQYDLLMSALAKEPEVITRRGKPVSVILPIKDYQKLIERLEDAEDAAYVKKARAKPMSFRSLKDYLADHAKARV